MSMRDNYRVSVNHYLGYLCGFCDVACVDFPLSRPFTFSVDFQKI